MVSEQPPAWDEPNNPAEWTKSWSNDGDDADAGAGESPTWPIDGRDTVHPATESTLATDTVGALREAHRRVTAGEGTLPDDAAAYLAQRTPFGLEYYEQFGDAVELDRRGWPVASWFDEDVDADAPWLQPAEWLELSDYLARAENLVHGGLEISSSQGLFAASAVGPVELDADASYARILSANLDGDPRLPRIRDLLRRMRLEVADDFTSGETFEPIFVDDGDGVGDRAYAFAAGFFEGVELERDRWERARRFEEVENALSVIYTLSMDAAGQTWPHPELPAPQVHAAVPKVLQELHDFLLSRRRGAIVREEPKIGRNDPCTCGSGKKYKKCHGAAA